MKTTRFSFFIGMSLLLFLLGCNTPSMPIQIGVVGTMSGFNSDLAVSGRQGIELAVEEFNHSGGYHGRKVELVIKDDKNNPDLALQNDRDIIALEIPVVIGHYTSGMMVKSMDYLRTQDILFLSPTISADSLSGIDDNFIRFIATTKEQALVLTDIAKRNNHKTFVVIYDVSNMGFNEDLYNNFKLLLEENQGHIVSTLTYNSNTDLDSATLAKSVADSKPDGLFIIANAGDNAEISQQLLKIGCKVQTYSPLWSNTVDLIKKGGIAVEGALVVGAIDINGRSQAFLKFKEDFLFKYGDNPSFSSLYSYESAKALFKAMTIAPDLKPLTLKKTIVEINDFLV